MHLARTLFTALAATAISFGSAFAGDPDPKNWDGVLAAAFNRRRFSFVSFREIRRSLSLGARGDSRDATRFY